MLDNSLSFKKKWGRGFLVSSGLSNFGMDPDNTLQLAVMQEGMFATIAVFYCLYQPCGKGTATAVWRAPLLVPALTSRIT
jgi:hypothetical protein